MGLLNVNGVAILRGTIRMPRIGVWVADLTLDGEAELEGSVTIATEDNAFSLVGTVARSGVYQLTPAVRIVGGAGGLADPSRIVTPKAFQGVPLSQPLAYVLGQVGETLSSTADAGFTSTYLEFWSVLAHSGKAALQQIMAAGSAPDWRILPDGTVWVGTDLYLTGNSAQFDVLERHDDELRVVLGSQQPFLLPGTNITLSEDPDDTAQHVSYVVHHIAAGSIRSEAWLEDASSYD